MLRSIVLQTVMIGYRMEHATMPRVPVRWMVAFFSSVPPLAAHIGRR